MTQTQKRRAMIAVIAAIGSLLAVSFYFEQGVSEKNIIHADEPPIVAPRK